MLEPGRSLEASKIGRLLKGVLKEFWIEKKSFLPENCEKFLWRRSLAPKQSEYCKNWIEWKMCIWKNWKEIRNIEEDPEQ